MQGQEATELHSGSQSNIGVDVSKQWLDVHVRPSGEYFRVANDPAGIGQLKRKLQRMDVACVACEATGKWHRPLWRSLAAASIPVFVADPFRVRMFARAHGVLAKTDAIDAAVLSAFAAVMGPGLRPPPAEVLQAVAELTAARNSAVAEQTALKNQLAAATLGFLKHQLGARIEAMGEVIAGLETESRRLIQAEPLLAQRHAILTSIPGIGFATAVSLIAGLAELGSLSDKKIAMLAGLAPICDQSGKRDGARAIRGGRPNVRRALYLAALSAARCNQAMSVFYKRLRAAGKPAKCALIAVARKLLLLANTLTARNRQWQPTAPISH
jgi:transposase